MVMLHVDSCWSFPRAVSRARRVAELAAGKTAWFIANGRDLWQIGSPPTRDDAGQLVFELFLKGAQQK